MLRLSKYNIFSGIRNSGNHFIINLLTGNADILNPSEADHIRSLQDSLSYQSGMISEEMIRKGYLMEEDEEERLYRKKYLDFIDSREKDEIQLFFVTNYSCNFSCGYCYQDQYVNPQMTLTSGLIDSFFRYIQSEFAGKRKYITIFGGEPLLTSPKQKALISHILKRSKESNLDVCIVTNGYTLEGYIDVFRNGKIREIQVTLDGTETVHNKRRPLKDGGGTFDKIVRGIDMCLKNNFPVNLRVVADAENIDNLPELAMYAMNKGWTKNPLFKTQIGRNYELHHCQSAPDKLFSRISLYEKIYELILGHPHILEFHKPAYSVSRFLFENGELPDPLFDSCPACKTEWAFDYRGKIYSCTATVGKTGESLGTFYPSVTKNINLISEWESRDVTSIGECRECNLQLACGGGCGSVAKNRTGKIRSADCRPVKELLELGFSAYFMSEHIHPD